MAGLRRVHQAVTAGMIRGRAGFNVQANKLPTKNSIDARESHPDYRIDNASDCRRHDLRRQKVPFSLTWRSSHLVQGQS